MEKQDIEEIIKEWPEEWRNPVEDISDSDEDPEVGKDKEKDKGKEKIGGHTQKEPAGEKRKASQEESMLQKREKMKAQKLLTGTHLGFDDYDNIAMLVQE